MKKSPVAVPETRNYEYGYNLAYKIASRRLAEMGDVELQCHRSGADCEVIDSHPVISLDYLNRRYSIALPDIKISLIGSDEEVPLKDKILLLHYVIQAAGTSLADKSITYKELPEGVVYFRTFHKRAIKPIVDHFGDKPTRLIEAARELGGQKADYGDAAVTIDAFKNVPITFVLWRGDEEFPAEGSILFNANIADYLSIEDINVLSERIAWKLVRALREGS